MIMGGWIDNDKCSERQVIKMYATPGKITITDEMKRWYNRDGYTVTGETLRIGDAHDYEYVTHMVFKGAWTRHGTVRDCGDHYVYAAYAEYYRIDKATLQITRDTEDK